MRIQSIFESNDERLKGTGKIKFIPRAVIDHVRQLKMLLWDYDLRDYGRGVKTDDALASHQTKVTGKLHLIRYKRVFENL